MGEKMSRAPGIYLGLSNEEYHADPAVGSSGIKELVERPYRFWYSRNKPAPKFKPKRSAKESVAKKFGSAYHTFILEPQLFNYKIKFGVDQSGIVGTLGEGEWERMQAMRAMLLRKPRRRALLEEIGFSEVSFFWVDEATGIMCKVRWDRFAAPWIVDLKTTRTVSGDALKRQMWDLRYDISGAMYSIGASQLKKMIRAGYQMPPEFDQEFIDTFVGFDNQIFAFLCQEKDAPYMVRCPVLSPYRAASGRDAFREGLKILSAGIDTLASDDYDDVEDME